MKKGILFVATLGLVGSCALASAQTTSPTKEALSQPLALSAGATQAPAQVGQNTQPSYFTIRAGVAFPVDSNLSNVTPIMIGVGVDYTFSRMYIKDGETFVSVDWLIRTRGSTRFNLFPFNINERFYLQPHDPNRSSYSGETYAFVGLGATLFDFHSSTFRFGGRAGLGVALGTSWVAEAALYLSAPDLGVSADAIGVYLGYKFGG